MGIGRHRGDAAAPWHRVRGPQPRRQLPRRARLLRQLPGQYAARDDHLQPRGDRRCHRPRLRAGRGQADGSLRARHRRPPARLDGHVQRLARPRRRPRPRRHRARRRQSPPALDRLDPYRQRPGHGRTRLRQVGRPARQRRSLRRVPDSRLQPHSLRATRSRLRLLRHGRAGAQARCAIRVPGLQPLPHPNSARRRFRGPESDSEHASERPQSGHPRELHRPLRRGNLRPPQAGGDACRAGRDRRRRLQLPDSAPAVRDGRQERPCSTRPTSWLPSTSTTWSSS